MISLFQGGPKAIGRGLLEGLSELDTRHVYHLLLPSSVGYEHEITTLPIDRTRIHLHFLSYPTSRFRFIPKLLFDHVYTAYLGRKLDADAIFMTANFPSLLSSKAQLVLQHNLHYLQPDNAAVPNVFKFKLERFLFELGIRKCQDFIVQLSHTKDLLHQAYGISDTRIRVVTMVPTATFPRHYPTHENPSPFVPPKGEPRVKRLLLPARYYPNKNHRLLLPLAERSLAESWPLEVLVTLDESGSGFMEEVKRQGLDRIIRNIGRIPHEHIAEVYRQVDALLFPTASESFGLPLVEALICRRPILTSDLPFTREVCGSAALYFPLDDVEAFLSVVGNFLKEDLASQENGWPERIEVERRRFLHSWRDIVEELTGYLESSAGGRKGTAGAR